jgi:ribokinase
MTKSSRICVVGSANVDLTFRAPRLPTPGETLAGRAFHLGMGGKGANQAVAAARLGAEVALVACVGNDTFGQEAVRRYRDERIDTRLVTVDPNEPTGTAAILVDDAAENCIVVVAGANANLSADVVRVSAAAIREADVLLCQLEVPIDSVIEAFRIARAVGVKTVLTPAPATPLPDELLKLCDVCVPNQSEAELLTGRKINATDDAEAAAHELRRMGAGAVVVTLGSRGALVVDDEGATPIPPHRALAVDPTGAGDAFTAALAVAWAEGASLRVAAGRAAVVAALTVTRIGTQSAFPTRAEVETKIAR